MFDSDKQKLREILEGEYAMHGKQLTGPVAKAWIRALGAYSIQAIEGAFEANARASRSAPVPADVLRFLPDPLGHLGPEEAWNHAPKSEYEGGFVTDQIMCGLASAMDSIERGDMVAARMAFAEAYKREVALAQTRREKARWWYTQATGLSRTQRLELKEKHLLEAAEKRWIEPQKALNGLALICREQGKSSTPYLERLQPMSRKPLQIETGLPDTKPQLGRISEGLRLIETAPEKTESSHSSKNQRNHR